MRYTKHMLNPLENQKKSEHTNMEPNVAAALAYLVTPISGFIFFILEKDDKFVKFHAVQSILFGLAAMASFSIASALTVVLIGFILMPAVSLIFTVGYVYLLIKAYNGEEYELPLLGELAKNFLKNK